MKRLLARGAASLSLIIGLIVAAPAWGLGLDPAFSEPALGPGKAEGVVVWSHGRSANAEDWQSPSPAYLHVLRDGGWDVLRFNRLSRDDTLNASAERLADHAAALKHQGYKQVVLAGQSFGAFLSLMAADASTDVDAVIATAPAAYGSFDEFYDSWRLNATKLYPLLEQVKRARVMVVFFHGDDFDPGGRGERSRQILAKRGLGYAVIDQPAFLSGHWAAASGLFLRRFGGCIRDFADNGKLTGELVCAPQWGSTPSSDLKLPQELTDPHPQHAAAAAPQTPTGSGGAPDSARAPSGLRDAWYGFYPNGREVLLGVEAAHGSELTAIYAIGPSVDDKNAATWSRRLGRVVDSSFVFEEAGKSTLRFRPTQDGGLAATWIAADGKTSMTAHLKPIDPHRLAQRHRAAGSAPVASTAAHGDGDQSQD